MDEIKDIRCNGTSIAITYQYGNVTIYNLLERLAFGGSSISGMPGENIFYDLHYLTIETKKRPKKFICATMISAPVRSHTHFHWAVLHKKRGFPHHKSWKHSLCSDTSWLVSRRMQKQFPAKTACIPRITITTAKQHFNHVFRFCRFALPRYQRSRRQQIHSAYSSSKPKSFRPKSSRVKAYYTKGLTRLFAGRSVLRFCPFCLMADISETVMLVAFSPSVSTLTMFPGLILLTDISVLSSPDFLYILVCVKCVTDYFACNSSSVKS